MLVVQVHDERAADNKRITRLAPFATSHNFTVLSFPAPALARCLPSGLKVTVLADTLRVLISRPLSTSHNFTVPSHAALARILPSGLKATLLTPSVCVLSV